MAKKECRICSYRTGTHHLLLGDACCSKCAPPLIPVSDMATLTDKQVRFYDDLLQLGVFWADEFMQERAKPEWVALLSDAVTFFERKAHVRFHEAIAMKSDAKVCMDYRNVLAPDFPAKALVRNPAATSNHHNLATSLVLGLNLSQDTSVTRSVVVVGNWQLTTSHGGSRKVHIGSLEGKATRGFATCAECNKTLPKEAFPPASFSNKSRARTKCITCISAAPAVDRSRKSTRTITCQGACGQEVPLTDYHFSDSQLKNLTRTVQKGNMICKNCKLRMEDE